VNWSATAESVRAWWSTHPSANVAIRTGAGLAVVEVDPRHGGDVVLARLEGEHGRLPATPEVMSGGGGGGRHLYFRAPRGLASTNIDGLEIKAAGEAVTAPPSRHPVTRRFYVWHPAHPLVPSEIAPLPGWLAALVPAKRPKTQRQAGQDVLQQIPASEYLPALTGRAVGRDGKALCPFHEERTPSLHAYEDPARGFYCFGCRAGGSIIDFGARLYGIDPRGAGFLEIRRRLAADLLGGQV
jgi:hypothetical protein